MRCAGQGLILQGRKLSLLSVLPPDCTQILSRRRSPPRGTHIPRPNLLETYQPEHPRVSCRLKHATCIQPRVSLDLVTVIGSEESPARATTQPPLGPQLSQHGNPSGERASCITLHPTNSILSKCERKKKKKTTFIPQNPASEPPLSPPFRCVGSAPLYQLPLRGESGLWLSPCNVKYSNSAVSRQE